MRKIYLSVPMRVPKHKLIEAANSLIDMGFDVSYWDRAEVYSSKKLSEADAVAFFGDSWSFDAPPGCFTEYKDCLKENKPVFVLYRRISDGEMYLYDLDKDMVKNRVIQGEPGTAFSTTLEFDKRVSGKKVLDRRILLLI